MCVRALPGIFLAYVFPELCVADLGGGYEMLTAVVALSVGALTGAVAGLVIRGKTAGLGTDILFGLIGSLVGAAALALLGVDFARI